MKVLILFLLFSIGFFDNCDAGEIPKNKGEVLQDSFLINSTSGDRYLNVMWSLPSHGIHFLVIKHEDQNLEVFPVYREKFVNWGIFDEISFFFNYKSKKIYFSNFDTTQDEIEENKNGIYVYDFEKKLLSKLTSEKNNESSFYRLTKFEDSYLYFQKITTKKELAIEKAKNNNTYFSDILKKLENETKQDKIKL